MTRLTRQTTWCAESHEQRLCVVDSRVTAWRGRSGFTLVELLVVVAIIGVLAALVTPAIFQARVSAQNAAIRAEIDLLHMGIMNYKNRFGSYPPCQSNCNPNPAIGGSGKLPGDTAARMHLERLFPRCDGSQSPSPPTAQDQFHVRLGTPWENDVDDDDDGTTDEADENFWNAISPLDSLTFWLAGYTSNPANPLRLLGGVKEALYDQDDSRYDAVTGAYYPAGKPNAPFIYIDASNYGLPAAPTVFTYRDIDNIVQSQPIPGGPYKAEQKNPGGPFYNPGKFQILNAGLDEQWGTDDDLSNFWKGTRGDQE
jgi:prepilin-type N-terminal cleavage/methylation domain-containing protein